MLKHKENYQKTDRSVVGRTHDFVNKIIEKGMFSSIQF